MRYLHNSGARYKYSDLFTYLLTHCWVLFCSGSTKSKGAVWFEFLQAQKIWVSFGVLQGAWFAPNSINLDSDVPV